MIGVIQPGYKEWVEVKSWCATGLSDGKTVLIKRRCLVWDSDAQGNSIQVHGYEVKSSSNRVGGFIPARFLRVYDGK